MVRVVSSFNDTDDSRWLYSERWGSVNRRDVATRGDNATNELKGGMDKPRPLNFARNSLNCHSRENGNPVPDQVEDKHSQLVVDSRVRDCVVIA